MNEQEEKHECEICGDPATHYCTCEACRVDKDENGEERDGRWLCDGCTL
jgi:hypothetical protein